MIITLVLYMICSRNVLEAIDRGLMTREYAEKVVIGSAICFDDCWQKARPIVAEKLFSDERNKFVWSLLMDMKREGVDVDVLSMWQYAMGRYPGIQNPAALAAYICDVTMVVTVNGYDKVLSELLRFFAMENRRNGW